MANYKSVKIGRQEWMKYNLNVRKFRNGDPVPELKTKEEWASACLKQLPACCFFENMWWLGRHYGKLYNWYAVSDPRGLAPEGWHVSSDREWEELVIFSGGHEKAGIKLKSKKDWEDGLGSNESGFSALPGGYRRINGEFVGIEDDHNWWKCEGYWWTSTEIEQNAAWCRNLHYSNDIVYCDGMDKGHGYAVRCMKDIPLK
jgi:uncharacterized protein (TIGR02145 family)